MIYEVEEPDPDQPGPARLLDRHEFRYPDGQWNSETLFVFDGDSRSGLRVFENRG